jgi:hypothetical protein
VGISPLWFCPITTLIMDFGSSLLRRRPDIRLGGPLIRWTKATVDESPGPLPSLETLL